MRALSVEVLFKDDIFCPSTINMIYVCGVEAEVFPGFPL